MRLVNISLERLEGSHNGDKIYNASTFIEANAILSNWALTAPEGRAYDKVRFTISTDEDKIQYKGRFDLNAKHRSGIDFLQRHIRGHCNFVLNQEDMKKDHESVSAWIEFVEQYYIDKE